MPNQMIEKQKGSINEEDRSFQNSEDGDSDLPPENLE